LKKDFSVCGIEGDEVSEGKNEKVTTIVYCGGDGGRITGLIVGCFPKDFAGERVEGDDSGTVAADVEDNGVALDQRRAGDAEEAFGSVEIGLGVEVPNLFSGGEVEAGQDAFSAVSVNVVIGNGRCGARTFIKAEIVSVGGGIIETPESFACVGIEAFNGFFVIDAMKEN